MYFRISFKYKYEKVLKMKNHYIPQFIIKKFSKAINVFNLKNGNIRENRPSFKVFYEKGIYDDEVEKTLNFNIETPFSKLLDDKLLTSESSITITREELLLIKRYMLVSSIRAQGEEHFREFLIRFKRNTDIFYSFNQRFVKSTLPYTEETTLSNRELLNNALLAFSKAEFIVIQGSKNVEHIRDNVSIYDFSLDDEDMKIIATLNNGQRRYIRTDEALKRYITRKFEYEKE